MWNYSFKTSCYIPVLVPSARQLSIFRPLLIHVFLSLLIEHWWQAYDTHWWWQRKKTLSELFFWPTMWRVARLLWPPGLIELKSPAFSGFAARCQSSEGCYLSRWEVLEVAEGQVSDQVPSVPDKWLMTSADVGRRHNFAEPWAERLPLLQTHLLQVPVYGLGPGGIINFEIGNVPLEKIITCDL